MKNLFFLFIVLIGYTIPASAQPPKYDDLLIYFADGDYEKLVDKAEKYITDSDTKKDPLPYLYSAKANFEMSKDQMYDEDFPKAYNDAIGNAAKAMKYDKDGEVFETEQKFFTDLKTSIVEEIKNMIEEQEYNRMRGSIMKLQRMDPNDVGSYYMLGAAQFQIKDKSGAKISIEKGDLKLSEIQSVDNWRPIDYEMLRLGVIEYSNYLVTSGQSGEAKKIMGKVKQWFEEDEIFMKKYDEIVN